MFHDYLTDRGIVHEKPRENRNCSDFKDVLPRSAKNGFVLSAQNAKKPEKLKLPRNRLAAKLKLVRQNERLNIIETIIPFCFSYQLFY
jgi:hypothetical protein